MSDDASVYTVPAGEPFLDVLARGILEGASAAPLGLADTRVLLPTRRACRALRDAFLRVADGDALILPRMQALGDVEEDETLLGEIATGMVSAPASLPPAIDTIRRKLLLTRLVLAFDRKRRGDTSVPAIEPGQAAELADDLAFLLDQVQTEQRGLDEMAQLAPADLAIHWQETLDFLAIITDHWPGILAEARLIDRAERRNRSFAELVAAWRRCLLHTPVIAAGSTGSIPATAELLGLIARLPKGAVILPGLDTELDDDSWQAIAPTHPQHGMKQLLSRIGVRREDVRVWPHLTGAARPAREAVLRAATRPADFAVGETVELDGSGFAGLAWLDHPTPQVEAQSIALMMRETLEQPERTAALITPDRSLARRVAAELQRWGIAIDDSAGTPLRDTPVGTFLRLGAELAGSNVVPVTLLALLKHPLAAGGLAPATFRRQARLLEREVLRGPRPAPGFAGLRAAVTAADLADEPTGNLLAWLDRLAAHAATFVDGVAAAAVSLAELVVAHLDFAEWLASADDETGGDRLWQGDAGEAAAILLDDIRTGCDALPEIPGRSYPGLFESLMRGRVVRPSWGRHPRLAILGTLEARLQSPDLVILGGLNEGTWPPEPAPDPWLSRQMRAALGLSSPERRIGQSAHDFCQAAAVPRVVFSRATKVGGTPTVPARWLLRLSTLAKGANVAWGPTMQSRVQQWAARVDQPARVEARPAPTPRPPLAARPRKMSVTRVESWMRDPYAVYAREILRLRKLDRVDAPPDAASRGIVIHKVLDRFVAAYPGALPDDAVERLLAIGQEALAEGRIRPGVAAFWWPRFGRIARWFVDRERTRRDRITTLGSEIVGELSLTVQGARFTVTAVTDRIDRRADGSLAIIDYKTGLVPTLKQIHGGWSPQLPLEAMIAKAGGFRGVDPGIVGELSYWRLTGAEQAGEERPVADGVDDLVAATEARLRSLVAAFSRYDMPYLSRPRPSVAPRFSDYDHLARVAEWSASAPEDTW